MISIQCRPNQKLDGREESKVQQLIREGMFDAYNQWLFGPVENLAAYDNWTKTHADQYTAFNNFQKTRVFKMPAGQYYQ